MNKEYFKSFKKLSPDFFSIELHTIGLSHRSKTWYNLRSRFLMGMCCSAYLFLCDFFHTHHPFCFDVTFHA